MRHADGRLLFSATDLSRHLSCAHLTSLRRAAALGEIERPTPYDDPRADVLKQRGIEHERRLLGRFAAEGRAVEIVTPPESPFSERDPGEAAARTRAAMRRGVDVVYQGRLQDHDGRWSGYPDFLFRVDEASALGGWSYEVLDAKLARVAKGEALLQLLLYSDLLAQVQGATPEWMHLALGGNDGPQEASFRVVEYSAYYRAVRRRFETHAAEPPDTYPEPVDHCALCDWKQGCAGRRRADDHLSLVAGITRSQRRRLVDQGVTTMADLGALDLTVFPPLDGMSHDALFRIREQARIQDQGRREGRRMHELITPVQEDKGLAALPAPSPGDLFFDLEGDAFATDGTRVPVRGRGSAGRLRRLLGARRTGREACGRAFHRPRHGALAGVSGLPHLPLRRLRDDRGQAPDEPLRHPRGRGRSAPARARLRRPAPGGPAGAARLGRGVLHQEAGAVLRLRAPDRPDDRNTGAGPLRGGAGVGRGARHGERPPRRDRGLQPRRLPVDAAAGRVAGGMPARSGGVDRTASAAARGTGRRTRPGAGIGGGDRGAVRGAHRWTAGGRRRPRRRAACAAAAGAPAGVPPARGEVHVVGVLRPLRLQRGGARGQPGDARRAQLRGRGGAGQEVDRPSIPLPGADARD